MIFIRLRDRLPEPLRISCAICWPYKDIQNFLSRSLSAFATKLTCGPVARAINQLFPEELPNFASWRKALKRIEERFAGQPEALARLRRMGLCRRRPRAR